MSEPESYEILAVRYGQMLNRQRRDNFLMGDPHDALMPIDYFVWALVNENRTIIVDTGFDFAEGKRREREVLRLPREGLATVGIDAAKVEDVIITHLHYDHAGTLDDFPRARYHLQELELAFTTGRHMCYAPIRHAFNVDHVTTVVRRLFEGRVVFHDGEGEVAPGVTVHRIGGHTLGLQSVRVLTRRGWVVLASDAVHFYENMERVAPFPIVLDVGAMIRGYETLRGLATSPQHIVPGHDPLVMRQYPAYKPALEGIVARLDVAPRS